MSAKLTLRPIGVPIPALLAMSVLASSALAQAPPFLLQWGTPGTGAGQFEGPSGVAVDAGGHVYVSDLGNGRIQKFTAAGAFITEWPDGLNFCVGVAVDPGGSVYVANINYVRKWTGDGVLIAEWTGFGVNGAWAVAADDGGDVYVVDNGNNRILKFTGDGVLITQWGTFGTGDGQFSYPTGIAVDATG